MVSSKCGWGLTLLVSEIRLAWNIQMKAWHFYSSKRKEILHLSSFPNVEQGVGVLSLTDQIIQALLPFIFSRCSACLNQNIVFLPSQNFKCLYMPKSWEMVHGVRDTPHHHEFHHNWLRDKKVTEGNLFPCLMFCLQMWQVITKPGSVETGSEQHFGSAGEVEEEKEVEKSRLVSQPIQKEIIISVWLLERWFIGFMLFPGVRFDESHLGPWACSARYFPVPWAMRFLHRWD